MMLPVPITQFTHMPERSTCVGSMEVGAPVAAANDPALRFIVSVASLSDSNNQTVGWVYLVRVDNEKARHEYIQGNQYLSASLAAKFGLKQRENTPLSSIARLNVQPSSYGLRVNKCPFDPEPHGG